MINKGDTIVYSKADGTHMFYWLVVENAEEYIFFSWLGNPRRATMSDYWRVSKGWFEAEVKAQRLSISPHFPEECMEELARQAEERNCA